MKTDGSATQVGKGQANWVGLMLRWAVFILLALIVLAPADPNRNLPLIDSSVFMYSGRQLLNGGWLYEQVWDNKPPLIHFTNALGMLVGNDTPWGIWFLDLLALGASIAIAYRLLSKLWGPIVASISVCLGFLALKQVYGQGNTVEGFSLPFTLLGILIFVSLLKKPDQKLKWLLLGACLAINFFYRANNTATLLVAISVLLLHTWMRRGFADAVHSSLIALCGFIVITLPLLAYFQAQGTLQAMWEAAIIYNFAYSSPGPPFLQKVFSQTTLAAFRQFMPYLLLVIGGLGFSIYDLFKKKNEESALAALLVFGSIAELAFSSISGRNYMHYYISWAPVMTLLIGRCLMGLWQLFKVPADQGKPWHSGAVNLLFLLVLLAAFRADWLPMLRSIATGLRGGWSSAVRQDELSAFLAENTQPEDIVWTLAGGVRPNLLAERRTLDGALSYPELQHDPIGLEEQDRIFENLKRQKPAIVVDASAIYPAYPAIDPAKRALQEQAFAGHHNLYSVLDYLWQNYEPWAEVDHYLLYKIKFP